MMVGDAAMLIKKARPSRKTDSECLSRELRLLPGFPLFFFFAIPDNAQAKQYSAQLVPALPSMFIIFSLESA